MERPVCLQLVFVAFLSPLCVHQKQKYNGRNILNNLGPHLPHMEFPRLGVESELRLLAYTTATATATRDPSHVCDLYLSSQQRWIPDPLSEARAVSWSRGRVLGSNPRRKQGGVLCCKRKGKWEGGLSHWMQPEVRGFRTRSPEVRPVEGTGLPCKGPKEGVQSASQLPTFHGAMESRTCKSSRCGSVVNESA